MRARLSINRCPRHRYYAIAINDDSGGLRLTPTKCCGSWTEIVSWSMSSGELRTLARQLVNVADRPLVAAPESTPAQIRNDPGA